MAFRNMVGRIAGGWGKTAAGRGGMIGAAAGGTIGGIRSIGDEDRGMTRGILGGMAIGAAGGAAIGAGAGALGRRRAVRGGSTNTGVKQKAAVAQNRAERQTQYANLKRAEDRALANEGIQQSLIYETPRRRMARVGGTAQPGAATGASPATGGPLPGQMNIGDLPPTAAPQVGMRERLANRYIRDLPWG